MLSCVEICKCAVFSCVQSDKFASFCIKFASSGTYIISKQLVISRSGVVLRGAGVGVTTLLFTKSLTDIYGQVPRRQHAWLKPGLMTPRDSVCGAKDMLK